MDEKKLEVINLLSKYNSEEITQIMIIMTYWDEMVENGIVSNDDINSLSELSSKKQKQIKKYITRKLKEERKK